jgi:hypothetical protein
MLLSHILLIDEIVVMVDEVEYEKDEMAAVPPPRARYHEMYA